MGGTGKLLEIGSKFGDYTVVARLGKGAMGEVYRITNGETDFAVKIMSSNSAASEKSRHEWRRRFAREAEVAMKIRHPNLVQVYDVGEDPQTHLCYIIMEYVGGGTLSDLLRRKGKLDIREAIAITMHIANALSVAHRHGVVHRDIKPDNIMFTSDGTPKLADLGIARVKNDDENETTITKTNMMVGTPAYMAPEQMVNSHDVDARADIYSLGVVLYEMLAGKRPNAGSTIVELMARALSGEEIPDIRKLRPEVSAALSYALSRMVANKMENRPASAEEAARLVYDAALGKIVAKAPSRALASGRVLGGGLRRHIWHVAICAATLAAILAFLHPWRTGGGGSSRRAAPAVTSTVPVVANVPSVVTNAATVAANAAPVAADAVPSRTPSVGEKPKSAPFGEREVPLADVPPEFRKDLEALQKRYERRTSRSTKGRLVFGRLDVEGGTADDVATWAWLNKDGTFVAAAVRAVRSGLVFLKNGYEPLVFKLEDADKPWRDDVALDIGTVRMKKLPEGMTATASMTIRLPEGVEGGRLVLMLINNSPCGLDWGTYGREKNYSIVAKVSFRNGERVTIPGCATAQHMISVTAPGCPKFSNGPPKPLSPGENYFGEFSLMRTKTAAFAVRPYGEKGGAWKRSNVNVDGTTSLLLLDRRDKCGNTCHLNLNAYGDSGKSVFSNFGWGSTTCEDLGEMTVEELERRERAGGLPPPDDKKRDFKLVPGHVYRIKNDWHWQMDLLVAFESYEEATQKARPDVNAIHSARANGYEWRYRLDADGNATLTSGGGEACISPWPVGNVVVPGTIDGHKVVAIGDRAFVECEAMTEVVIPEGIRAIEGWHSFARCRGLKGVKLPKSLEHMWKWSFEGCTGMKEFDVANCRWSEDFGCVFSDNRNMSKFTAPPGNPDFAAVDGVLYTKDRKTLVAYPKDRTSLRMLPGVRKIEGCALSWCSIRHLKVPNGVEEVCGYAFEFNNGYLETVEFPKSLRKIGYVVFRETHSIKKVVFHGDAPEYVNGTFGWNNSDFVIEVERGSKGWNGPGSTDLPERWPVGAGSDSRRIRYIGDEPQPAEQANMETGSPDVRVAKVNGQYWFYKLEGGKAVLVARNLQGGFSPCVEPAPAGRVVVPAALDGHNVTVLDNLAFLNCSGMTEIVLPECLEEIREWKTFYRCESLREITLPPKLRKMGVWTFEKCRSLRRVNLMNCEDTHSGFGCIFKDCNALEEILCSRKNKVAVSVNGALYSKDKRTLLAYPKTQKEIRLLPSTRNIANSALVSLPIRRVKIPNGIEFVDACNFEYDEEGVVQSVEFPKSLKSLGDRIFKGTSRVKTVIFNGNAPELPKGSPFAESDADFTVEVRRNSKGWIRYGSSKLPEKWPVGDPDAMPIRHIDGK